MTRRASAFTFIEVIATLVIVALLAAAVGLSSSRLFRSARLTDVCGRLAFADDLVRRYTARNHHPAQLLLDLDYGQVTTRRFREDVEEDGHHFSLPDGFEIQRLVLPQQTAGSGQVTVPCSELGHTPTYALEVSGVSGGSWGSENSDQRQWLLIAGLTGQVVKVDHEQAIEALFETLSR